MFTTPTVLLLAIPILLLGLFLRDLSSRINGWLRVKAPVLRRYWIVTAVFWGVILVGYIAIWKFSAPAVRADLLSIIGSLSAIGFASYVGYFAFAQMEEGRSEKLKENGYANIRAKSYGRAADFYEKALASAPADFQAASDLLELYVISGEKTKFTQLYPRAERMAVDARERLVLCYINAANELFLRHLVEAGQAITACVQIVRDEMAGRSITWNFEDLRSSPACTGLQGEAKQILDNLIKYLGGKMTPEHKALFESGNHLLTVTAQNP